jgi:hypothetical protein
MVRGPRTSIQVIDSPLAIENFSKKQRTKAKTRNSISFVPHHEMHSSKAYNPLSDHCCASPYGGAPSP